MFSDADNFLQNNRQLVIWKLDVYRKKFWLDKREKLYISSLINFIIEISSLSLGYTGF